MTANVPELSKAACSFPSLPIFSTDVQHSKPHAARRCNSMHACVRTSSIVLCGEKTCRRRRRRRCPEQSSVRVVPSTKPPTGPHYINSAQVRIVISTGRQAGKQAGIPYRPIICLVQVRSVVSTRSLRLSLREELTTRYYFRRAALEDVPHKRSQGDRTPFGPGLVARKEKIYCTRYSTVST